MSCLQGGEVTGIMSVLTGILAVIIMIILVGISLAGLTVPLFNRMDDHLSYVEQCVFLLGGHFLPIVIVFVLITFNIQAQESPKIATEKWRCFSQLDYNLALLDGGHPSGKGLVQLSQSTMEGDTNGVGTVSIAGIIYPAKFQIIGLNRHWEYISQE